MATTFVEGTKGSFEVESLMAIPLLSLLPKALKVVGKIVGVDIFNDAAQVLEAAQQDPAKAQELELALLEHERELRAFELEEVKTAMAESLAMINSEDKYTRRARPTGLYIAYGCTVALTLALIFQVKIDPVAVLTLMGPLFGAQSLYIHNRTREKMNGNHE